MGGSITGKARQMRAEWNLPARNCKERFSRRPVHGLWKLVCIQFCHHCQNESGVPSPTRIGPKQIIKLVTHVLLGRRGSPEVQRIIHDAVERKVLNNAFLMCEGHQRFISERALEGDSFISEHLCSRLNAAKHDKYTVCKPFF